MKCKLLAVLMLLLLAINVCCLESPSYYQYSSYFDDSNEWKILTEQEVMGRIHLLRSLLSDELGLEKVPNVYFRDFTEAISGECNTDENCICLNNNIKNDNILVLITFSHEMYHLYQYKQDKNMDAKYITFGNDGYDNQVYELEARNYSMDVYNRLIDRG